MSATVTGDDSSPETPYDALVDRCQKLESSQKGLKKQFESFSTAESSYNSSSIIANRICDNNNDNNDRRRMNSTARMTSDPDWNMLNGAYFCGNPNKNLLQCMGHALWLTRPDSGEIIYWNRAAEKLFGYKCDEIYKLKSSSLQVDEDYILVSRKIMQRLKHGGTWSGQFPFRRKTGEIFMALVTQTPMYEEEEEYGGGEFVGIITVASDAAIFNSQESKNSWKKTAAAKKKTKTTTMNGQDDVDDDDDGGGDGRYRGVRGLNLKRICWDSQPHMIKSFVSDLVQMKKPGEDNNNNNNNNNNDNDDKDENEVENPERPPRIPVKERIFQLSKSFIEKIRAEEDDGLLKREATAEFL